MTVLTVHHRTLYRYRQPVQLGVHRLMVRPRETRDVRLLTHTLVISPDAKVKWSHDIHGNAVAGAEFPFSHAETLQIDAFAKLELTATTMPLSEIEMAARSYPFRYSDDDFKDLNALLWLQYADPEGQLRDWAHAFVRSHPTDTLALLMDLNSGVSRAINYQAREDEGTQSPVQTLTRGWGACRDLAVLFLEAVRSLGFGARLVSGYIHDTDRRLIGSHASGTTHAWVEVYVPGAGWITFDPTNSAMGGANLIPVAVGRDIHQVMPVSGSFIGASNAFLSLSVSVKVLSDNVDAGLPLFAVAEP